MYQFAKGIVMGFYIGFLYILIFFERNFWEKLFGRNSLFISLKLFEYERDWFVCKDFVFCQDFVSMEKEGKFQSLEVREQASLHLKTIFCSQHVLNLYFSGIQWTISRHIVGSLIQKWELLTKENFRTCNVLPFSLQRQGTQGTCKAKRIQEFLNFWHRFTCITVTLTWFHILIEGPWTMEQSSTSF